MPLRFQATGVQRMQESNVVTYDFETLVEARCPVEIGQEIERAQAQQLKRLQYEAALAERQYHQVDPDNRLVAAELENRWEAALVALKQAEESFARTQADQPSLAALPVEIKEAFMAIGQKLPRLWNQEAVLSTAQKKALLRCLIDKVVIHRTVPDQVQTRIVWRGGATTTLQVPVTAGGPDGFIGSGGDGTDHH